MCIAAGRGETNEEQRLARQHGACERGVGGDAQVFPECAHALVRVERDEHDPVGADPRASQQVREGSLIAAQCDRDQLGIDRRDQPSFGKQPSEVVDRNVGVERENTESGVTEAVEQIARRRVHVEGHQPPLPRGGDLRP
jgi:hypothetical protein